MTAIIVARPLVLGEDPGILFGRLTDTSNMFLTALWLLAATGWAAWRVWSGNASWYGSAIELGLAATAIFMFVSSALAAPYKHPAWLISWEWLTLVIVFCLVRQLAADGEDNQRLLAALIAGAVSISVYAVYQYAVELPQQQARSNPVLLQRDLAKEGFFLEENDPVLETWMERVKQNNAFATFAHPNTFAGFLGLLLPPALGWALASYRRKGWKAATVLAGIGTAIMALAFWLTHSRGAILAAILVGSGMLVVRFRSLLGTKRLWILGALAVVLGAAWLGASQDWGKDALAKARHSFDLRLEYWTAAWAMIRKYPWLGVGPGNFGRFYPRFMLPSASEQILDPHNFALEMWATGGLGAMLALLIALAIFFKRTRGVWSDGASNQVSARNAVSRYPEGTIRLEFYLGGMAGLILSFALWATGQVGENVKDRILLEGVTAGTRSIFWFGAFFLFENIPWISPSRALALTGGVAICLLNLMVSGGISLPSLAQPVWIMAALTLASLPQAAPLLPKRNRLALALPLPLLGAVGFIYFVFVFSPTNRCDSFLKKAQRRYQAYRSEMDLSQEEKEPAKKQEPMNKARFILEKEIPLLLENARKEDPTNVTPILELVYLREEMLRHYPKAVEDASLSRLFKEATTLDREGKDAYLAQFHIHLALASRPDGQNRLGHLRQAVQALGEAVNRDPTSVHLRYQLADLLFQVENQVKGKEQAQAARDLNDQAKEPRRRLTPQQLERVQKWLKSPVG